jgi:protein-tyrosine kinase
MSLIESALAKLRRAGESEAQAQVRVARPMSLAASAPKAPALVIAAAVEAEEPSKRVKIDLSALRDKGYFPQEGLERRFADHYRQIKRPLIEKALANTETRLIVVTSAMPGDGKSFTSINLALSIARERDASVLLVDADLPRANISRVCGVENEPGLTDALLDETRDVESLVIGTDIRGFDVLPTGKFVDNATELVASARMGQITARLMSRQRRLVLLDSPPLLGSSEAHALVRLPAQVIIVVRAGVTPRHAIGESVALVERSKLQGIVLNGAPLKAGAAYYYGYPT